MKIKTLSLSVAGFGLLAFLWACSGGSGGSNDPIGPVPDPDPSGLGGSPNPDGSAASTCGGQSSEGNPYPCCPNGGNCTFWAWKEAADNWGVRLPGWGNANQWDEAASALGYVVSSVPAVGTIMVLNDIGSYGHLVWVTAVDCATGTITGTEESCCDRCGYGMKTASYRLSASRVFIYGPGAEPPAQDPCGTSGSPAPTIAAIGPGGLTASNSPIHTTLSGSNFVPGDAVTFTDPVGNELACCIAGQPNVVNSTTIEALPNFAGIAGTWRVRVTSPSGQVSNSFAFTVSPPPQQVPVVSSVTQPLTASNSPTFTAISGSSFVPGDTVMFTDPLGNELPCCIAGQPNVVNSTTIEALPNFAGIAGTWRVRVTSPSGQVSNSFAFTVSPPPQQVPVVDSVTQPLTASNSPTFTAISGSSFVPGDTVTFTDPLGNELPCCIAGQPNFVNSTTIEALPNFAGIAGTWRVRVTSPSGQVSNSFAFTVSPPPQQVPVVDSVTQPLTASNSPTFTAISGSSFAPGDTVTFTDPLGNELPCCIAGQPNVVNSTTIEALPNFAGIAGTWRVRVTSPSGQVSNSFAFTVSPPPQQVPVVSSVTQPLTASNSPTFTAISGSSFAPGDTVTFTDPLGNELPCCIAGQPNVVNSTTIEALPNFAGIAGTWRVRVTSPTGQVSNSLAFTVSPPPQQVPVVYSVTQPLTASNSPTFTAIFGSSFLPGDTVTFADPIGNDFACCIAGQPNVVNSTTIETLPNFAGVAGTWRVRVTSPTGQVSNSLAFTVSAPQQQEQVPVIYSVTQPLSASNSPTFTAIFGSSFLPGDTVTFTDPIGNDFACCIAGQPNVVNSTTIETLPNFAGVAGTWGVRVTSPSGQVSNSLAFEVSGPRHGGG